MWKGVISWVIVLYTFKPEYSFNIRTGKTQSQSIGQPNVHVFGLWEKTGETGRGQQQQKILSQAGTQNLLMLWPRWAAPTAQRDECGASFTSPFAQFSKLWQQLKRGSHKTEAKTPRQSEANHLAKDYDCFSTVGVNIDFVCVASPRLAEGKSVCPCLLKQLRWIQSQNKHTKRRRGESLFGFFFLFLLAGCTEMDQI